MRNEFCASLVALASDPAFVFLTGDLGFMALEPLRDALGDRFINAGIAEQNMVSVAAGLAAEGLKPWCYSIAPFIYARPYEQIRNDICLHDLPVRLVGNGGGYGYGVMGATHHAIEDCGALGCLPYMQVLVPAFGEDVNALITKAANAPHPAYLRLGRDEKPKSFELPAYAGWRRILDGDGPVIAAVGPLRGSLIAAIDAAESPKPRLWAITELPVVASSLPPDFLADIADAQSLLVAEEHVATGGAGQAIATALLALGQAPKRFIHRHALGYPSGRYGSQGFHRRESGLDAASLLNDVRGMRP